MSNDTNMDNRILAEFHGWHKNSLELYSFDKWGKFFYRTYQMDYHTSYGWLMPVWEKFRELRFDDLHLKTRLKHANLCQAIVRAMAYGTLTDLYTALVEAVKWYNEATKPATEAEYEKGRESN